MKVTFSTKCINNAGILSIRLSEYNSLMETPLSVCHCSYEQSHFTVVLTGKTGLWWIGLRAHGGEGGGVDYIWDNDLPLTFTHWDKDQPGTVLTPSLT